MNEREAKPTPRLAAASFAWAVACVAFAFTALPAAADMPFTDVPATSWAYGAVEDLWAEGIIEGYPETKQAERTNPTAAAHRPSPARRTLRHPTQKAGKIQRHSAR